MAQAAQPGDGLPHLALGVLEADAALPGQVQEA